MNNATETILIFAASPTDQPQLSLDVEVREIENGLRNSRKHFQIKHQWATRAKDLRRALLDYKPEYVHFCGHGAGKAGIVLEGQLVDGEALAGLFSLFARDIKCVVLNACYSSVQARAIAKHIDFVVGMRKEIGDSAAIEFAAAFYDALGSGESIDFAFALGCNAIQLAGIPEHLTPKLVTRPGSAASANSTLSAATLEAASARQDWDGAPAVSLLYGREAVAELLKSWILDESCRVVLITGLGGVGKTDLATCLGRGGNQTPNTSATLAAGIQGSFESVLWRSLLNSPPPEELFGDILDFLSEHRLPAGESRSKQLDQLLTCLLSRRCLIVLDNVEAILRPGDPSMRYREGYEQYGTFFEMVAKTPHQSCLLLTSREKPRAIADLEGARRPVRSITLTGIGAVESQSLFAQIGSFYGNDNDWDRVVNMYNGNPLALELAARHIEQVFGGNLGAFLGGGRPIFADIEELLDWHLDRLSREETDVVYWLAVEREPVTLATLYGDLVSRVSREKIASTIQSLQRRMPLERVANRHFGLQPVLIEHVTGRLVGRVADALAEATVDAPVSGVSDHTAQDPAALDALRLLNTHALVKATSPENVRETQRRMVLAPVAESLVACYNRNPVKLLASLISSYRQQSGGESGYAPGNIINLLSYLKADLHGFDFSHLPIWQACLHEVNLHETDFSFADFRNTTFRHPFGAVFSVSYSPDGQLIAVGDDNGQIHLFFAENSQFHMSCVGHSDVVSAVTFTRSGERMASSSYDNTVRIWSTRDGQCVDVLVGHEGWVYSLAFSPDGSTLATASEDGSCRLWDLKSGNWACPATDDQAFVSSVAFSPDGQLLATAGSGCVINVFALPCLRLVTVLGGHSARIRAIAFSLQGDMLASGDDDGEINLWRPDDGGRLATLSGHSGAVMSLSFSAIGDVLASASQDHTVRLWSTSRRKCVGQLDVAQARVWSTACSPTGRTLVTGSEDGAVRLWDMDRCQCLATLRGYSNKTWALAFSPKPSMLLAGNEDGLLRLWDVSEARTELELLGHKSRVWAVACSPDGNWVASASDDQTVRLWDSRSGVCVRVLRGHSDWIRSVAFDPDSRLLASAGEDGKILVFEVATGGRVTAIEDPMARVFSVTFCRGATLLAAGGTAHEVRLFSPLTGTHVRDILGHQGWLNSVSSLNDFLATCSDDGTVSLFDLKELRSLATLAVGCKVHCGTFSHQGKSFVTGGADGMLRRWSVSSAQCEAQVRAHQGSLWSLSVNSSQGIVATAGDDGCIRLWQLPELIPCSSPNLLRPPRPYEGMNISGATGLTLSQRDALVALGAIVIPST